ncbi:hypothetical protein VN12_18540 [Pirellula sp. SH-Sr6A]|uniref:hypothetical protein n=1 Tax=Pirellula sp. SH-Sr6A TaxID=1632865 RepID=UPI00078B83D0|nr:hypothetical protein [Pirellula sp. SH-Sr6A]AMV34135.1 hypothetical protein VN12_18540 [Pirellula sp. SH-Sr6A]
MTKIYQGIGLRCMYPENWNLIEDTEDGQTTGFTLESPTSAFMTVSEYPWNVSPRSAVESSAAAMMAEYEEVEQQPFDPQLTFRGEVLQDSRGADLQFYFLDLLVTSRLIAFTVDRKTYLVQIQAEDRDFMTLEQVFQAMLISMLQSLEA